MFIEPVVVKVPEAGSYNSALARTLPDWSLPPATRTLPFNSNVAVKYTRPTRMLPVYDCGDHLHPSDAGYNRMGDVIDLALFE
jgi:lysophospholipase L1-like esterase